MTTSDDNQGSAVELDTDECLALLRTTTVGAIAFSDDEGQQLIAVNFALLDGEIFFRTAHGTALSSLSRGDNEVAFGVLYHDVFRDGWNVTVRGTAHGVEDRATINKVIGHHQLVPWAGGTRPVVIRVTPRSVAGRRVSRK